MGARGRGNIDNRHQIDVKRRAAERAAADAFALGNGHRCRDKIRFTQASDARAAARRAADKYGHAMGVYRCPVCDGYHLTHKCGGPGRNGWGRLVYIAAAPACAGQRG